MGSFGAGRLLLLLAGAFIALFEGAGQARAGCDGDYCDSDRSYSYSYARPRVYYSGYSSYSDCGSSCGRTTWDWSWLFGSSCDRGPCYRYRPRYAYAGYYPGYGYNYYDMYNPKNLPPLRAGDNGMLPGVNPRQEWFNKHGTTGYAYYGYYGYGSYYGTNYGYPYRHHRRYGGGHCGQYGYWNGDYCSDARWERPRHYHARWYW